MGTLRVHAFMVVALTLAGCSNFFPYQYVELTGENVEVTATGKPPPLGYVRFGRDRIPMRYVVTAPGVSLTLAVGEGGAPNLDVASSAPIRAVVTDGHAFALSSSRLEYRLAWAADPSTVGKEVQIRVDFDDGIDSVSIAGVIAESGRYFDCACGL